MSYPSVHWKLYYTDSRGEKRYLLNSLTGEVMKLYTEQDALKRRWAEGQQGQLLNLEHVVEHTH